MTRLVLEISDAISSYKPDSETVERLSSLRKDYFNRQEGKASDNTVVNPNSVNDANAEAFSEEKINSSNSTTFKELKSHEYKSQSKAKKNKSSNSGCSARKKDWENEGLLAFTNSKCYEIRESKTMFFQ